MDARRVSRTVIDPNVRQVGFFAPQPPRPEPEPPESDSPVLSDSPASRTAAMPVPESGFRRKYSGDQVPIGSNNPSESLLGNSPVAYPSSRVGVGDGEFSEDSSTAGWFRDFRRSNSGKSASSLPGGGLDLTGVRSPENSVGKSLNAGVETKTPAGVSGNGIIRGWCYQGKAKTVQMTVVYKRLAVY